MNIVLERLFVVGVVIEPHIVKVALYVYFSACGTPEAKPRTIKEPTTPRGNEGTVILNCCLESREPRAKESIDVLGPRHDIRVDGTKFLEDGGAEGGTCSSTADLEVVTPRNVANKAG